MSLDAFCAYLSKIIKENELAAVLKVLRFLVVTFFIVTVGFYAFTLVHFYTGLFILDPIVLTKIAFALLIAFILILMAYLIGEYMWTVMLIRLTFAKERTKVISDYNRVFTWILSLLTGLVVILSTLFIALV
jgi:hypothetical protein